MRPEHLIISDTCEDDTFILGTPWLTRYGINLNMKERTVHVPTKSGVDVIVQGVTIIRSKGNKELTEQDLTEKQIFAISLRVNNDLRVFDVNGESTSVAEGEELKNYDEEIFDSAEDRSDDENSLMGDEDIKSKLETLLDDYKICFVEISGLGRVDEKYAHKID